MNINISGIYKITNLYNNKVYIGSSKDITERWRKHVNDLKNNKHHSGSLQDAWNKHGEDMFKFEIIELVNDENLLFQYEQKWLNEYKSYDKQFGYNISEKSNYIKLKRKNTILVNKSATKEFLQIGLKHSDIGLLFQLKDYMNDNNELVLDGKYLNQKDLLEIIDIDKTTFIRKFKVLETNNIMKSYNNPKNQKYNIYLMNPKYFRLKDSIPKYIMDIFELQSE